MSDTLDWQTVRAVLEAADPVWAKLSNDAREPQWNFATKLLNIFRERTSPVCSHCQQKRNILTFYRCWDCKAFLCENCIKSHFGDNHTPHPKTVEQYDSELATLRARSERLEAALREIAQERDAGRHDGLPEPCPVLDADTMFALAREALASPVTPSTRASARERVVKAAQAYVGTGSATDHDPPEFRELVDAVGALDPELPEPQNEKAPPAP